MVIVDDQEQAACKKHPNNKWPTPSLKDEEIVKYMDHRTTNTATNHQEQVAGPHEVPVDLWCLESDYQDSASFEWIRDL